MASSLRTGKVLKGMRDSCIVAQKLHDQVWTVSTTTQTKVILKYAPKIRLQREKEILQQFKGNAYIRQLTDHGQEPPFLVLEHLHTDALRLSGEGAISRKDVKFIARSVLSALDSLHAKGIAHTDIKPDNILLNLDNTGGKRVVQAKLADSGDAHYLNLNPNPHNPTHAIGAAIFRSPEALLGLEWSTPTDIWSFGATLISLLLSRNFHIFKPPQSISADDPEFPVHVLMQQTRFFGPFPLSYEELLDDEQERILAAIHIYIEERGLRKPFAEVQDEEITPEDKEFIFHVMRLDPRDRPSAGELLEHGWFDVP